MTAISDSLDLYLLTSEIEATLRSLGVYAYIARCTRFVGASADEMGHSAARARS